MKIAVLGATGKTGRLFVEQALAAGHELKVLARNPAALPAQQARLEIIQGDAADATAVARLVEGTDAVVSALGPTKTQKDICSQATQNVLAAKPKRYVAVSGAGIDWPGDKKDLPAKLISMMIRLLAKEVFEDKAREAALIRASDVPFVLVRAPRLVDAAGTGSPRVGLERSPGATLPRADLARFLLSCLTSETYWGKAPFVAA